MELEEARQRFIPAVEEILELCRIVDEFVDKERFQVMIATIWGNAVLDPAKSGITSDELSVLHDFLNEELVRVLGEQQDITGAFEFIVSRRGQDSMARLNISQRHNEFLLYFARLILQRDIKLD